MPFPLSPQSIDALAEIISGGSASAWTTPSIGLYRKGYEIEKFMRACRVPFALDSRSRVPALTDCLMNLNGQENAEPTLTLIIETAADPRDFVQDTERHAKVLEYLNSFLRYDGFELQQQGHKVRLVETGQSSAVLAILSETVEAISFDTVQRDIERALASVKDDPEDAVTAACAILESVCRSMLKDFDMPLPDKKDLSNLYKAVRAPLGLSGERADLDASIAEDVRNILSGLTTVVNGIGALRSHGGDAHGREKGYKRLDGRIASLAVHAAGTVALFLIETWQRKKGQTEATGSEDS